MFSKIKVVFVMLIVAVFSITVVYSAVISPAKCVPAKPEWISTGTCTRDSDGYCSGVISWQHHIVSYDCDTTEAGTCTETEVTFTSYPNVQTINCLHQWVPTGSPCPFPDPPNTDGLPSQNFVYDSCY
jgi:hypothetical protein